MSGFMIILTVYLIVGMLISIGFFLTPTDQKYINDFNKKNKESNITWDDVPDRIKGGCTIGCFVHIIGCIYTIILLFNELYWIMALALILWSFIIGLFNRLVQYTKVTYFVQFIGNFGRLLALIFIFINVMYLNINLLEFVKNLF
ncbi:MAG: hypothetical protein H8E98_03600 [Bacteroidetes bacterium]|nr:hypothetical protein [Bacteroidota bacterium]